MARYRVTIEKETGSPNEWWRTEATLTSDMPSELAKFLRHEAERIRKEPYMAPRSEGEEPLEGLQ